MGYQQLLPIVVEKTVKLSGLDWENQCILNAQSEIGFFPAGEGSLYRKLDQGSSAVPGWIVGSADSAAHPLSL